MTKSTLSLILFSIAIGALLTSSALADGVLTTVSGNVEVGRGEPAKWAPATDGEVVSANDRVRTGADGRVEIELEAGTLRVHENSMLRLPPTNAGADRVDLEEGRSLFDVLRRGGRRFEVHTPTVVVSVKGTRFGVDAGTDVGEVTVYRGTVGVREAGSAELMETLVREGFLATGGFGIPVEIDVSTTSDPWQAWQDFDRAALEERRTPGRMGEMERAKATLHRATAADVIVKAAERKPEVAKRLKEIQEKGRKTAKGDAEDAVGGAKGELGTSKRARPSLSMPAAPDPGADPSSEANREILKEHLGAEAQSVYVEQMRRQALEMNQVIEANRVEGELDLEQTMNIEDLSGGGSFSGSNLNLDFAALYEMSPAALLVVRTTLVDLQAEYQQGTYVPTAPSDLVTELETALVNEGFSNPDAIKAVQILLGN